MTSIIGIDPQTPSGRRNCAQAFEPCFEIEKAYPNGDKLPGIWITAPTKDDEGNVVGRKRTLLYPNTMPDMALEDTYGEDALYFGGCYYDEAMGYTDALEHDLRVECFRAAELLYRHSAGQGNMVGSCGNALGKRWILAARLQKFSLFSEVLHPQRGRTSGNFL